MKKIDNFTNLYPVSKTLRFKAIPVGKTQENIELKHILEDDNKRAEHYAKAKKIIDRYHIEFINRVMNSIRLSGLSEYQELYLKNNKSEEEKKQLEKKEEKLREEISKAFTSDPEYKTLMKEELVKTILPNKLTDKEELKIVSEFVGFYTAFSGYNQNRENMYSKEAKATAIAYRCINENLPMFISNIRAFEKIKAAIGEEILKKINKEICPESYTVQDCFNIDFFSLVLSADGIRMYNTFIGGLTKDDGTKIQGLNEYINLFNQKVGKSERIPQLKLLYKLMLTDSESLSFIIDKFNDDQEVISNIANYIEDNQLAITNLCELVKRVAEYDGNGIIVKNGPAITTISKDITGEWSTITNAWNRNYDLIKLKKAPKDWEKYEENRRKAYKSISSFSLADIDELVESSEAEKKDKVSNYFSKKAEECLANFSMAYNDAKKLLSEEYPREKKLSNDSENIEIIKALLDAIKNIEVFLKPIKCNGNEDELDEIFYGEFYALYDSISGIDRLYDKVRNYVTAKPYSKEKYKLYFQNPQFMNGWDRNKETDYMTSILKKDGLYYLAVFSPEERRIFEDIEEPLETEDTYEKMIYKQIQDAGKYLSSKQINPQNPPSQITKILMKKKEDSGSLSKDEIATFIEYLSDDFLVNYPKILDENGNPYFDFHFKNAKEYTNLKEYFVDVEKQAYILKWRRLSAQYINRMVDEGKLYLFQIYNKDFSKYSHGKENLHTMIFREALGENNGTSVKLCGGAELFFRKSSIKKEDRIIHPAKQAIKNKNPLNKKRESIFEYDLIKNKRFTTDQYEVHIPVTLNRNANGYVHINERVRMELQNDNNPYIIGIDRGERNLIYVCVIDGSGKIVEQCSLNEIVNEYHGGKSTTDYHTLLDQKEKERLQARENWQSIENIKELKEGYVSQVIHKICSLVQKYDAVIAMEDLNSGFKNSRVKVEKQVYQNFEKALITKLNYLSNKDTVSGEPGSIANGYQLTESFRSFKDMRTQNGIIFYIPAWLTSKIDPVTGFADLIRPQYTNIENSRSFIKAFDSIYFDKDEKMFVFKLNMNNFERTDADYKKEWTLYSYGERIRTFRNAAKNNEWDHEELNLTEEFMRLMNKFGIVVNAGEDLRESLCKIEEKDFYIKFLGSIRLMLQMRNSISGRTDVDYLISPVKDSTGGFYDSRRCGRDLPQDADANGAYNIARKVLWAIDEFKKSTPDNVGKVKIAMTNKQWLEYVQK